MSERDEAEERFQAWAAQQTTGPHPRKYNQTRRWEDRFLAVAAVVFSALFWGAVLFGMVRCVGQAVAQPAAQPSVQNPFDRSAPPPRRRETPERPRAAPSGPFDAEIAKRLIAESIARYRGSCACPYQHDRAGRSCGRRSAYNRPRGAKPLCFEADVTSDILAAARSLR
ncbi:hypothetical protein [Methylobacterium sp. SyP6R]|uniref:hypothetical protein n=1 Tax=Methylobacterium sp. SyP6R TaxID=2718876 RepID=UPI001F1EEDE4|nr:hypothetical protein [Methylobacterium sp. SyP6R]MCF4130191.1 hypothetical protein [Methylobacterium sp. SyP6R]